MHVLGSYGPKYEQKSFVHACYSVGAVRLYEVHT